MHSTIKDKAGTQADDKGMARGLMAPSVYYGAVSFLCIFKYETKRNQVEEQEKTQQRQEGTKSCKSDNCTLGASKKKKCKQAADKLMVKGDKDTVKQKQKYKMKTERDENSQESITQINKSMEKKGEANKEDGERGGGCMER